MNGGSLVTTRFIMLLLSCLFALGAMPSAPAHSVTVAAIVAPGAAETDANGINGAGQVVGSFDDEGCRSHGFLRTAGGTFTTIDTPVAPPPPGAPATKTYAEGINDGGEIVGDFWSAGSRGHHGYLRTAGGTFTTIDVPGGTDTYARGINDSGEIVGSFYDAGDKRHGYLRARGGTFNAIDVPGATETDASAINGAGQIVGSFHAWGGKHHGYLRTRGGTFTAIDVPGAIGTEASGINDTGWIVGSFYETGGKHHSYLRTPGGTFTTIDYIAPSPALVSSRTCTSAAGGEDSYASGINNAGQIVGSFIGDFGKSYGYIATPSR